jgi:hypothetical protein
MKPIAQSKVKVSTRKAAEVLRVLQTKKRPRGRAFPKGHTLGFKKGQSGNPGGKPKILMRFGAAIAEELLKPCPRETAKELGLRGTASNFEAMIASAVRQGIWDWTAALGIREVIEGKLPTRNFNLSASAERFFEDPKFREFLEQAHGEYLQGIGVLTDGTNESGITAQSPLRRVFGKGRSEEE